MSDMKKFLRFEISGYVALLYGFIFCFAFSDLTQLVDCFSSQTGANILNYSITGFILAGPIGFIMHQIDISIFCPFKECRWYMKSCRLVVPYIKSKLNSEQSLLLNDKKYQPIMELALSHNENRHIDEEISNRYSYYYARMEAGLFSPVFGALFYCLFTQYYFHVYGKSIVKFSMLSLVTTLGVVIISICILSYCKTIFDELNDLERIAIDVGLPGKLSNILSTEKESQSV